jgi:hypothetical protein
LTRKRTDDDNGLSPLSAFLPGIVSAVTVALPPKAKTLQGKHHYTKARQFDDLMAVRNEQGPDMGFMTRLLTLCTLPRTNPGNRLQYKRENGPFKLVMIAGGDNKLPFGNLPRLLLAWVCTEAVKTQSRELILGHSLSEFMRELGMFSDSGGSRADRTRLREQIDRLFACNIELIYQTQDRKQGISSLITDERDLWWDYKVPEQDTLWQSRIRLGEKLFQEIIAHPVPLDMRILKAMRRSSLGLDLYLWLSYKTFRLYTAKDQKPERLSWARIYAQFGSDPSAAGDHITVQAFRKDVLRELRKLKVAWPALSFSSPKGCLEVKGCEPSVTPAGGPSRAQIRNAIADVQNRNK